MSHTKEPWGINNWTQPDTSIAIGANGTPLIARVILRDVSIDGQAANARRIVACVNACAGIPSDQLECDTPTFVKMLEERTELRTQRDDLHSVLAQLLALLDLDNEHTVTGIFSKQTHATIERARAIVEVAPCNY